MKHLIFIVLIGAFTVITFDTIASFISKNFDINYAWFMFGSFLIYSIAGFISSNYDGLIFAILAGGAIALVDSTLGWYISWIIGPGRPNADMNSTSILSTVLFVTITGVIFGLIGGLLSRFYSNGLS